MVTWLYTTRMYYIAFNHFINCVHLVYTHTAINIFVKYLSIQTHVLELMALVTVSEEHIPWVSDPYHSWTLQATQAFNPTPTGSCERCLPWEGNTLQMQPMKPKDQESKARHCRGQRIEVFLPREQILGLSKKLTSLLGPKFSHLPPSKNL